MYEKKSPTTITTTDQMTYYLMNESEILNEIKRITNEVNEILSLPSTTVVRLILNYFQWDTDALTGKFFVSLYFKQETKSLFLLFGLERFFEDPEKLFRTLNVANPSLSPSLQWNPLSPIPVQEQNPMVEVAVSGTDKGTVTCRT